MKLKFVGFACFLVAFLIGCKQDFDVTADYKEVPVVYGLLNQQDNVHFVRIQKGYLIDGNALLAAGVPDSIYYSDDLSVKIIPLQNGSPSGSPFTLKKVNGDTLNPPMPKDSGTFAKSPNILYRFTGNLDPNKSYKLEIINASNNLNITATTTLVKDFEVIVPTKGAKLNMRSTNAAKAVFQHAQGGGIYDLSIRFHYREYNQNDNSLKADTYVDFPVFRSLIEPYADGVTIQSDITSDILFRALSKQLQATPEVYREFNMQKGMVFKFSVGGDSLARYLNTQQAQSGLVSNEALPIYSNVKNGVGIFSSRYFKQVDSVLLSNDGIDTLACSVLSKDLRFKNHLGQLCQ